MTHITALKIKNWDKHLHCVNNCTWWLPVFLEGGIGLSQASGHTMQAKEDWEVILSLEGKAKTEKQRRARTRSWGCREGWWGHERQQEGRIPGEEGASRPHSPPPSMVLLPGRLVGLCQLPAPASQLWFWHPQCPFLTWNLRVPTRQPHWVSSQPCYLRYLTTFLPEFLNLLLSLPNFWVNLIWANLFSVPCFHHLNIIIVFLNFLFFERHFFLLKQPF